MSAFSGLPNVGSLIPSIDKAFIKFDEIPVGRQTCDVCGDFFSISGHLNDCPVGLPCRHVHCFKCTWDWLHRTHSCPECNTEYTDIRPICVALEHEAYLCRYQGYPPSTRPQVGFPTSSKPPADIMQEENRNVTFVDPRNFDVRGLPERRFHRGINPKTEELEGAMTGMYLHPEKKDGISAPHPHVHSTADASRPEPEAKIPQQPHIHQKSQTQWRPLHHQPTNPPPPRKSTNARTPSEPDKKPRAKETDSQRADRLRKRNAYNRDRLAKETEEQREHRLEKARRAKNARRVREIQEENERQEQKRRAKMGAGGKGGAKA